MCILGKRETELVLLCRRDVGVCTVVYFGKERGGSLFCCVFWEGERWELVLLSRRKVGVYTVVYFGKERGGCSVV